MAQNTQWRSELAALIAAHNDMHALRPKTISHRTRQARAQGLFRMFGLLRRLGFCPAPGNLSARHVQALVDHWTGAPVSGADNAVDSSHADPVPMSAAYIQQQLSFLRVFARWIGKPGLVRPALHYVDDRALVARAYSAGRDKGWRGNGVEPSVVFAAVERIDRHVGVQLRLMHAFGLRRKEAVMFDPRVALVPAHALPASAMDGGEYLAFLRVKRGTKGGRLRYTAVRTEAQHDALSAARDLARRGAGHIGRPGLSLRQSLDLFSNVVRLAGVTRRALGITAHGLRHQFAADLYFDLAQVTAPVQGGGGQIGPAAMRDAYRQVARQLGHRRPQISNAYLGSPSMRAPTVDRGEHEIDDE